MPEEKEYEWSYGKACCRICGCRWVAVFPVGADEDNLECPECRHAAGELEEDQTFDFESEGN